MIFRLGQSLVFPIVSYVSHLLRVHRDSETRTSASSSIAIGRWSLDAHLFSVTEAILVGGVAPVPSDGAVIRSSRSRQESTLRL